MCLLSHLLRFTILKTLIWKCMVMCMLLNVLFTNVRMLQMKFCLKNIISKLFAEYQVSHFLQNGVVTSHLLSSLLEIILFLIHLF